MNLDSLSPEATLLISLVNEGEFVPGRYGVSEEMVEHHRKEFVWCAEYQDRTGKSPDPALLLSKFPRFPWVTMSVDPSWAAEQVVRNHGERQFRGLLHQAVGLLNEDDLVGAHSLFRAWQVPGRHVAGHDVFETLQVPDADTRRRLGVPWDSLARVVGGLVPGDLWYVSGRPGEGKSWTLTAMVAHLLLRHDVSVRYFSLEMPARDMARRVVAAMTTGPRQAAKVASANHDDVLKVIEEVRSRTKGRLKVVDPSTGSCDPAAIASASHECDVVVVDHMGLVRTGSGGRVVDDWRAMHAVSNELKEIALATQTVMLAASQLNRSSESSKETTTAHLSQSDALGQDADVVLALRRPGSGVAAYQVVKNRRGANCRWFTRFDPSGGQFDEISREAADAMVAEEEK